jgi:putative ABC transport system ATP-binding protein
MANQTIVKMKNISKDYTLGKTKIQALSNIDLDISGNDFLVIAGPSGSGKTTLLNIIGLIDTPSAGELWFGDKNLADNHHNGLYRYRRDKLGYIFQTFNLIPVMNVYENVEYPLILKKISKRNRKTIVEDVLHKVGLFDRKNHKPNELSGGQRQRVSIARAIVKKPAVVLADEPTANLDSKTGTEIIELMQKLNQEEKITFVFSSHDPRIIERGNRVIHLHDGEIIQ